MSDELPDINTTRGEKALAAVLVVFLLIGGLWVYFVPLDRDASQPQPTPAQQHAIQAYQAALSDRQVAADRRHNREQAYERAREDYRTDLDADAPAAASKRTFERARTRLDDATRELRAATANERRLEPAANRAQAVLDKRVEDAANAAERNTALLRLG